MYSKLSDGSAYLSTPGVQTSGDVKKSSVAHNEPPRDVASRLNFKLQRGGGGGRGKGVGGMSSFLTNDTVPVKYITVSFLCLSFPI